jgi:hypothetical protein
MAWICPTWHTPVDEGRAVISAHYASPRSDLYMYGKSLRAQKMTEQNDRMRPSSKRTRMPAAFGATIVFAQCCAPCVGRA